MMKLHTLLFVMLLSDEDLAGINRIATQSNENLLMFT